ncbi:MAG: DUF1841 family protein [Thiotrichales bacterium]|nr:DUF1841 family protein [Thiotrichales bacterium]MBT5984127.1 DUF1841 family protein [Thiotrichales bacterium]MBT6771206.1 DUF1841 family protein [Thiotrichales bacterium]MBT7149347.1 DUF1841 family protein [Thiotrichales bacterium]
MFTSDRSKQRQYLKQAWEKYTRQDQLEPLELQLAKIVEKHPEYHDLIKNLDSEYFPEQGNTNPFLHINLHLTLQDQLTMDQPKGIRGIHNRLLVKIKDEHEVEHMMMEHIAEMIFNAQKNNTAFDLNGYIIALKKL